LNGAALPAGDVERVAYEGALDDQPEPILLRGEPAVVWQAEQSGGHATIETSRFSPATVQAPSPAEQFGLGVANPLGAIAILIFGGVGLGVLIAAANILIILALVLVYIVAFRFADRRWKWSAFGVVVSALVYVLLVPLGAPSPPVLFLTSFAGLAGVLALAGALLFTVLLNQLLLRRLDDVYRAAIMATCTLFFLGFLQALVFVQGQLGRI
jgi:hypothetical protein